MAAPFSLYVRELRVQRRNAPFWQDHGFPRRVRGHGAGGEAGGAGGAFSCCFAVPVGDLLGGKPFDFFAFNLPQGHVPFIGIPHAHAVGNHGDFVAAGE